MDFKNRSYPDAYVEPEYEKSLMANFPQKEVDEVHDVVKIDLQTALKKLMSNPDLTHVLFNSVRRRGRALGKSGADIMRCDPLFGYPGVYGMYDEEDLMVGVSKMDIVDLQNQFSEIPKDQLH